MSKKRLIKRAKSAVKRKAGGFRKARKKPWEDATLDDFKRDPDCKKEVWVPREPKILAIDVDEVAREGEYKVDSDGRTLVYLDGEWVEGFSPMGVAPSPEMEWATSLEQQREVVAKALGVPLRSVNDETAKTMFAATEALNEFGVTAARAGKKLIQQVAEAMHQAAEALGSSFEHMEEQKRRREKKEDEDDDDGTLEFDDGDEMMDFFRR
jgi:hypothetical protein